VLGLVFLAVTGAETLYADLGHFGRLPIQVAWLAIALPALTINYLGTGCLGARPPGGHREPLLPDVSELGIVAGRPADDRRPP
jgi:KUP system potassium uptake protein